MFHRSAALACVFSWFVLLLVGCTINSLLHLYFQVVCPRMAEYDSEVFAFLHALLYGYQAAEVYAELKKKVVVKQQRQSLESQLCSLIRIEGGSMSCKVRILW